ncbi:sulfite exporter TauE/SafE family protein [bacterium]|nr:sulfite exporter TauE/SafE family protein [bacterium]
MPEIFRIFTSFGAGLLSFFSPCVLPLIPAYICFITGLSSEELCDPNNKDFKKRKLILTETILFILGFSLIFVLMGASAGFLGTYIFAKQKIIRIVGGAIVILFGMHISGLLNIRFLQYEKKLHLKSKPVNKFGSFLVGIAFGIGWTPCIGPMLGSILMLAANDATLSKGILLLSFYSLGLALPFLLLGIGIGKALVLLSKIKRHFKLISTISGILLSAIGVWIIIGAL